MLHQSPEPLCGMVQHMVVGLTADRHDDVIYCSCNMTFHVQAHTRGSPNNGDTLTQKIQQNSAHTSLQQQHQTTTGLTCKTG
jgi:hypothetical protein